MATSKPGVLKALINGVYTELKLKSTGDQVYLDDSTTLNTKLSEIEGNFTKIVIGSSEPAEACLWFQTEGVSVNHVILEEQTLTFTKGTGVIFEGLAIYEQDGALCSLTVGKEYVVVWDGVMYKCTAMEKSSDIGLGNVYFSTGDEADNTGEPFIIGYQPSNDVSLVIIFSNGSDTETHSVAIYERDQTVEGFQYDSAYGAYVSNTSAIFQLVQGETYNVIWDGMLYRCGTQVINTGTFTAICVGDCSNFGGRGNGEPFVIGYVEAYGMNMYLSTTTESTHTVAIYQ